MAWTERLPVGVSRLLNSEFRVGIEERIVGKDVSE
jgi:hypothetical protein